MSGRVGNRPRRVGNRPRRVGNRLLCYCDDCQAFAFFLGGALPGPALPGGAGAILDDRGGTEIFQTSPARVEIQQGRDRLACMRLTPNGLVRWYADCCRTPVGNTLATSQLPFVGLIQLRDAPDAADRDALLGPIVARVHTRFARGDPRGAATSDRVPLFLVARFAGLVLRARLRGDHRASPFFDPRTGVLGATPRVLTPDERMAVEAARDAPMR